MDLNELLAKRARAWESLKEIMARADNEKRELTAEERSSYDKAAAEVESLGADIKRAQDFLANKAKFGQTEEGDTGKRTTETGGDDTETQYRQAFEQYMRYGMEGVDTELRQVLHSGMV